MNILNKKGYALTYTVIVIAILSILGISLLYASSVNYSIKIGDEKITEKFYNMEGAQAEVTVLLYEYLEDEIFNVYYDGISLEDLQEGFGTRVRERNRKWDGGLTSSSRINKNMDAIAYKLLKKDDEPRELYAGCSVYNVYVAPKYRESTAPNTPAEFICMQLTVIIRTSSEDTNGELLKLIYEIYKPEILPSADMIEEGINNILLYDITKNMLKMVKRGA